MHGLPRRQPCVTSGRRPAPPAFSPVDPDRNTFWYRRPVYEQQGVFAEPKKVLFLTKTDTTGGALPPGTGNCTQGDPLIAVVGCKGPAAGWQGWRLQGARASGWN